MTKLEDIEGVGATAAGQLRGAGVDSIEELLKVGATSAGRKKLAAESGVSDGKLLEWVNHADLMRIKGIGSEYADLLEAAGVDSVPELGTRNAENLHAKLTEINAARKLVRREPSLAEAQRWIAEAKTLERVVTH
jgi:predicted flap endonuclease-1-like 5' DNA nuclease